MGKRDRSRGWVVVSYDMSFEHLVNYFDLPWDYWVIGFEVCPTTGRDHLQMYMYFDTQRAFSTMKRWLPKANLRKADGNADQNFDYCMKEHTFFEFGKRPEQGKATWEKVKAAMEDPESNFALYNQYKKNYDSYRLSRQNVTQRQLYFIKTSQISEISQSQNSGPIFYDSDVETYDGEDVVILDAFGHGSFAVHKWMKGFPKRIRRGFQIVHVNPSVIYITYSDPGELAHLKNCFSDIEYIIWSKVCVSQEDLDLIEGNQVTQEQEDINESIESYDLTRR